MPNWVELCRAGVAWVVDAWAGTGCANSDLVVVLGDELAGAAAEAGGAVLNNDAVDIAPVVAPNCRVGAADCAVADGCEAAVVAGACAKRLAVASGCEAGVDVPAFPKRLGAVIDGCDAAVDAAP